MKKQVKNIGRKSVLAVMEGIAVFIGLILLACGILVWRLTAAPIEVGFARDYLQSALNETHPAYNFEIGSLSLEWPELDGPLMFNMDEVTLKQNNQSALKVEQVSMGVHVAPLFIGSIKPSLISVSAPEIGVLRTADNQYRLNIDLGEEDSSSDTDSAQEPDFMRMIKSLAGAQEMEEGSVPEFLLSLQTIQIKKAIITIEDEALQKEWQIKPVDLRFERTNEGLRTLAQAILPWPSEQSRDTAIEAIIDYRLETNDFSAAIGLENLTPPLLAEKIPDLRDIQALDTVINGRIDATIDEKLTVQTASAFFNAPEGFVNLPEEYDAPIPFNDLNLRADYNVNEPDDVRASLSIKSHDVLIQADAAAIIDEDSIIMPVFIEIPYLEQAKIQNFWPKSLLDDPSADWLVRQLSAGHVENLQGLIPLTAARDNDGKMSWSLPAEEIGAKCNIFNMDVDYRNPLKPLKNAGGTAIIENDTLTINVKSGTMAGLDVKKGRVQLNRLIAGNSNADITVDLRGDVKNIFSYIQDEPIGVKREAIGLAIDQVRGSIDMNVDLHLPKLRDLDAEDVDITINGTVRDYFLPDVLQTLDLSGSTMKLTMKDGIIKAEGNGFLNGNGGNFSWTQYIDESAGPFAMQVTANVPVDDEMRRILDIGLEDWLEGTAQTSVTYQEFKDGRATALIAGTLGSARLKVEPLDFISSQGEQGDFSADISFTNGDIREITNLKITTPSVQLDQGRFIFENRGGEAFLRRGVVPVFKLDENDIAIEFENTNDNILKMAVNGTFLDARPFLEDRNNKNVNAANVTDEPGQAVIASVSVGRMRTHATRLIEQAKIYVETDANETMKKFELDAVAGTGQVYLRFRPNEQGIQTIRLEADDAGAMLKAFDLYDNMQGGKLVLYGESSSPTRNSVLSGNLEITDFRVVKAPVLARLVNAISLIGIQQLLGNDGINFVRGQAEFEWYINKDGDTYVVRDGRTSGSSLGLSADGSIDKSKGTIDIRGTIIPVSMVSEIVGNIPLIGNILTGGDGGGIIAATYTLKGDAKQPQVSVNPLSALAPGILRRILFEN